MKRLLLFILICICVTYDFASMLKTRSEHRAAEIETQQLKRQASLAVKCRAARGHGRACETN